MDLMEKYKKVFGEYPELFALPVTDENFPQMLEKAISEKKPIWSYYFDVNPYENPNIDI